MAKALNYLHHKRDPIIHHDVSSGNVLLWRQGDQWRAKVSDYGTAHFVRQSSINYAGNAVYCAPESLREDPSTPISCKVGIMERWKGAVFFMYRTGAYKPSPPLHAHRTHISPPPPSKLKAHPSVYKKLNPIRSPWIKAST